MQPTAGDYAAHILFIWSGVHCLLGFLVIPAWPLFLLLVLFSALTAWSFLRPGSLRRPRDSHLRYNPNIKL